MKRLPAKKLALCPPETRKRVGRRQRRSEETCARIYQAALALFAERGFNATTIEAITDAADVGKGTFFNYFASKEHVLLMFRDQRIDIIQTFVDEHLDSTTPLADLVLQLALSLTHEFCTNATLFQSFIATALTTDTVKNRMAEGLEKGRRLLSDLFAQRQRIGEIRTDLQPEAIAHTFQRTIFGTMVVWAINPVTSGEDGIRTAMEIFISGIRATPGTVAEKNRQEESS